MELTPGGGLISWSSLAVRLRPGVSLTPSRVGILDAVPSPEKALISRIRRAVRPGARIAVGIGDDSAVLRVPRGQDALVTTDFSLEGVHFRRDWHEPEVVGHRCLTRGLSDIAAMGGVPIAAFLSLGLPRTLPQRWIDRLLKGFLTLADEYKVSLAGGDVAEAPGGVLADIVVVGSVPKGKAILRSGARPGDRIYVTGRLGGASAALAELLAGHRVRAADYPRHFHPTPRLAIGRFLRQRGLATSGIDLSDGLSTDLAHICEESGVGAEVAAQALPLAIAGAQSAEVNLVHALHGGDDYELLFTAGRGKQIPSRIAGVPVTLIGYVRRGTRLVLVDRDAKRRELQPQGWQHFKP